MRRQRNPNDDPNDIEDFIFKMEGWPIQSDNMRQSFSQILASYF